MRWRSQTRWQVHGTPSAATRARVPWCFSSVAIRIPRASRRPLRAIFPGNCWPGGRGAGGQIARFAVAFRMWVDFQPQFFGPSLATTMGWPSRHTRQSQAKSPVVLPSCASARCASTPPRKRRCPRDSDSSTQLTPAKARRLHGDTADSTLGPASESRQAHLQRHNGGLRSCPRCRYYLFGDSWLAMYGSFESRSGPRGRIVWLSERPPRWGGTWGLGCTLCCAFHQRRIGASTPGDAPGAGASTPGDAPRARVGASRFGTKWARFEIQSSSLQAEHISQHQHSTSHKVAVASHMAPDEPVRVLLQKNMEDDQLLAGAVPQPSDWLRCWRLCMDPKSWESASKSAQTEHYIAQIRNRPVQARSFQAMVMCLAEVVRERKRQTLREATAIFLGFDDKNGRKLLLFKADTPKAPPTAVTSDNRTLLPYGAQWGVIGCLPCGGGPVPRRLADWERDYAERTAEEVEKLLATLCTPAGDTLDEPLLRAVLGKVRGLVVDGALLKTGQFLRSGKMPNVAFVLRDPSHVIRATCRDPLHDGALFGAQYERLFEHDGIIKKIHDSSKLQDQLEAAQRELLESGGSLGGGLRRPLRHMSFAQPRFESFVVPRRRYVCLLRVLPHLLAARAGDMRLEPKQRASAEAALEAMSGADCFTAGLAGDFGEVSLQFLRNFDQTDHDPAQTLAQIESFVRTLQRLFVQEYVICAPTPEEKGASRTKTLTQIALEAVSEPLVVTYGSRTWTLWGRETKWQDCKEALASIAGVARDVIARVEAEFRAEDLYASLVAFDLDMWSSAGSWAPPCPDAGTRTRRAQDKLRKGCRRFGEGVGLDISEVQWQAAGRSALRLRDRATPPLENRQAWRALLDSGQLSGPLEAAVRFYLATWDGTGAVERGLGQDAAIVGEHIGSRGRDGLYSALVELKIEGPQTEEAMFTSGEAGVLYLTEFSRSAARQWLASHGRRFTCSGTARKDKGKKAPPPETRLTDAGVQSRARAAYKILCRSAEQDEDASASTLGHEPRRETVLGIERKKLVASVSRVETPAPRAKTVRFRKGTEKILAEKRAQRLWTGTPHGRPTARLGGALALAGRSRDAVVGASRAARFWLGRPRRGSTPAAPAAPAPAAPAPAPDRRSASAAGQQAREAIRESLDELFRQRVKDPPTVELLIWLKAVAKGGAVTTACGETFVFTAAMKSRRIIHLGETFCRKHKALQDALKAVVALKGSGWRLGSTSVGDAPSSSRSAPTPAHRIENKRGLIEFLLRVRRIQRRV